MQKRVLPVLPSLEQTFRRIGVTGGAMSTRSRFDDVLCVEGEVLTRREVQRLPSVSVRDLDEILGRVSVRQRLNGPTVIGRRVDGTLCLARYLHPAGWSQVPGGWHHDKHLRPYPVSDAARAVHVWAAGAPLIPWLPPATAGKKPSAQIKETNL
jgi:hypothetical protein